MMFANRAGKFPPSAGVHSTIAVSPPESRDCIPIQYNGWLGYQIPANNVITIGSNT